VAKSKITRTKHIPQRTCVGCRLVNAKKALTRVVRTDTGIQIDKSGKIPGRGAYVHDQKSCWQAALKGKLSNALKTVISDEDRRVLEEYANNLPDLGSE
jgi:predicted RNA-binding protein YlxR (DUF448 family)